MAATFGIAGFSAARSLLNPAGFLAGLVPNPFSLSTRTAPAGPTVLQAIQKLNRLETCRYQGQVIVRGDTSNILPTWVAGDRLLFVGHGEVVAGVDLSRLGAPDIRVKSDRVELRLPEPQIFHTRLDNGKSEVFDRQSGFLTGPDRDLEKRVRQEAENRIQAAALEQGVLNTAETNAREALQQHLKLLGFNSVTFL